MIDFFQSRSAKIASILTSLVVIWGAATYAEVRPATLKELKIAMDQIQKQSDSQLLLEFKFLMQKRLYGKLTPEEQIDLCRIIKTLNFDSLELRRDSGCPAGG